MPNRALRTASSSRASTATKQPPTALRDGLRVIGNKHPAEDADLAVVHGFARDMKIACQDLYDDPFNPEARANLVSIILRDSGVADAARYRLGDQ